MEIIDFEMFKIVLTDRDAFILPTINHGYGGHLVLANELKAVLFERLPRRFIVWEWIDCNQILGLIKDRGYSKVNIFWNQHEESSQQLDHFAKEMEMELVYEPRQSERWTTVNAPIESREEDLSFCDKRELLLWLLRQPLNIFGTRSGYICGVYVVTIIDFVEMLVPTWNPMYFLRELHNFPRDTEIDPWHGDKFELTEAMEEALQILERGS